MAYKYLNVSLIVFCKAPIAGQVKTRLMPAVTADEAAYINRFLTLRLLDLLTQAELCPVELWCSPHNHNSFFQECDKQFPLTLHTQYGDDLGERMADAIQSNLERYHYSLLMGSDCPSLTINDLDNAIQALQNGADIALAPAEDGGYTMVGMSSLYPEIFDSISWGTDKVLEQTEKRIRQQHLSCYKTPMQWDIDTIEDWQRFCSIDENKFKFE